MDPLFYSDPNEPTPLIRVDEGYCDTFWILRGAVAADALPVEATAEHVRTCERCAGYIAYLKAGPAMPDLPVE